MDESEKILVSYNTIWEQRIGCAVLWARKMLWAWAKACVLFLEWRPALSTRRLRLSNYWNRSTLTPHPTDWPTQTSKDFYLGTCILMGGNWSPGQSIGIARLLFDRFSYLHIPLSYTTLRQQLTGYHTANIFQSLTWWTHCKAQDLLKKFFAERERKTLHDMQNLFFLVDQCRIGGRFCVLMPLQKIVEKCCLKA